MPPLSPQKFCDASDGSQRPSDMHIGHDLRRVQARSSQQIIACVSSPIIMLFVS